MILKIKWGTSFVALCFLAGCGDDKRPSSQTAAPSSTAPPGSESCTHKALENEPIKEKKPAPRSPVESYARQVSSGNIRKHLSGVGVPQANVSLPPSENSDECKARIAERYQECLRSVKENDPASKRRCDVFKQWFRDRCQASSGSSATNNPSKDPLVEDKISSK